MANGYKGFKKVHDDEHKVVMRRDDGHEFHIAKSALSPKLRGQLAEIMLHSEQPKEEKSEALEPESFAQGGKVGGWTKKDKEDFAKGSQQSGGQEIVKAVSSGVNKVKNALGFADGGLVEENQSYVPVEEEIVPGVPQSAATAVDVPVEPRYEQPSAFSMAKGVDPMGPQKASDEPSFVEKYLLPGGALPPKPSPEMAAPASTTPPVGQPSAMPMGAPAASPEAPMPSATTSGLGMANAGQGQAEQKQGLRQEAAALGAQGKEEAEILQKSQEASEKALAGVQEKEQQIMSEVEAIRQDIADGHIDPNHYMASKTTGERISTAVGLILGGMGGGLTGQSNPALDMLNKQIDRDIEAQRLEMGKKQNLLSALNTQFDNVHSSAQLARGIMMDNVSTQLKAAAAKAMDPLAKARALQAAGVIDERNQAALKPLAAQMQMQQLRKFAETNPARAQEAIDQMKVVDPKAAADMEAKYVPGMGFATAAEGAVKVKDMKAMVDGAKAGLKDLLTINKMPGKSLDLETRAKAEAISQSLVGMLRVPITGPGAMNEGERKMLERLVANPTDMFSLDNNTKVRLETLGKRLDSALNTMATANGVRLPSPGANLTGQQKSFYEWAQKNPKDPRAKLILEKLGVN